MLFFFVNVKEILYSALQWDVFPNLCYYCRVCNGNKPQIKKNGSLTLKKSWFNKMVSQSLIIQLGKLQVAQNIG